MEYKTYIVYAIILETSELYHIYLKDGSIDIIFPEGFKNLYIGITGRSFEERMEEHLKNTNNINYTVSKKLYDSLRINNFYRFKKIILADNLTEREAKNMEIYLIKRFDSYINGLNSNPGGGAGLLGGEHPHAVPIKIYNNITEEIKHFDCQRDAAIFLDISSDNIYAVTSVTHDNQQTFSTAHNAWFQIKRADDETPFVSNMKSRIEKLSGRDNTRAVPIKIYNNSTEEIKHFDCQRDAAKFLGVDYGRIKDIANLNTESEQTFSIVHNAWFQIKRSNDDTPFIKNMKTPNKKLYQPIAIFDIDSHEELLFDGSIIAAQHLNIDATNIGVVLSGINKQFFANGRRYDVQKIPKSREWNIHLKSPKIRVYYINTNGDNITFNSIKEAAESTKGKWAFCTQKKAITKSIHSDCINIMCKSGYKWYARYPMDKS